MKAITTPSITLSELNDLKISQRECLQWTGRVNGLYGLQCTSLNFTTMAMERAIKLNLINSYKTNNYIGQRIYKMQLVSFLAKKAVEKK